METGGVAPLVDPLLGGTTGGRRARCWRWLPAGMLGREWLTTLGHRRSLAVRALIPVLLAVPLVVGGAPTFWAGMLLTVLVAMVGAVGSGVAVARARSSGVLLRLAVVPKPEWRLIGGWMIAAASVDAAQLVPLAASVLAHGSADVATAGALLVAIAAALLCTNGLGFALARFAGSAGEVLLDVVVVLAPLLFLGGLFTGIPATGWRHWAAVVDPFTYLHAAFVGALGGSPAFGPGVVALASGGWGVAACVGTALVGRAILDRP